MYPHIQHSGLERAHLTFERFKTLMLISSDPRGHHMFHKFAFDRVFHLLGPDSLALLLLLLTVCVCASVCASVCVCGWVSGQLAVFVCVYLIINRIPRETYTHAAKLIGVFARIQLLFQHHESGFVGIHTCCMSKIHISDMYIGSCACAHAYVHEHAYICTCIYICIHI